MPHDPRADKIHGGKASSTFFKNVKNKPSPQCARVQARLLSYLDGSVSERERYSLQQHLDSCDLCRRELALYQMSEQALNGARHAAPPAGDLRAAFYARLASETAPRSSRPSKVNWRLAVPALAACSVLLGVLSVPHQRQTPLDTARIGQGSQIARVEPQNSVAVMPGDALRENLAVQPASSTPFSKRIVRNLDTLPPVQTGAMSGSGRLNPNARTRRKPVAVIIAGVGHHREAGSDHAFLKLPVSANATRMILGRKSTTRQDNKEATMLAYLDKQQSEADQSKSNKMIDAPGGTGAKKDTDVYAYDEQGKTRSLQPGITARQYAFANAFTLNTDAMFKDRSDNMPSLNTFALGVASGASPGDAFVSSAAGDNVGNSLENGTEDNGIAIQVRDSRRGFTSSMRLASQVRQRDGRQVLTIHVEDEDASSSSTETYAPLPGEVRVEPE
jgi:hypothetical protein